MATKNRIRLGLPSDIHAVDDVIAQHKKLKEEVLAALNSLFVETEGLVIEKGKALIEEDMKSTGGKIVGRGIIIVSGVTSIILTCAGLAPVGAAIGIGGVVVGYLCVAGSKYYEITCSRARAQELEEIFFKVEKEVNRYTESQKKVFGELGTLSAFDPTQSFGENLEMIRDIVKRASPKGKFFPNIGRTIAGLEECFSSLSPDKKEKLNSDDFLVTMSSLTKGTSGVRLGEIGTVGKKANRPFGKISHKKNAFFRALPKLPLPPTPVSYGRCYFVL